MLEGSISSDSYRCGLVGICPRCIAGQLMRSYPSIREAQCLQCGYVQSGDMSKYLGAPEGHHVLTVTRNEKPTDKRGDRSCEWERDCDTCPIAIDECAWQWNHNDN